MKLEPEEPGEDLIYLKEVQDLSVVSALRERFERKDYYTRIGQNILVAVNPQKPGIRPAEDESNMKAYAAALKEGLDREPHLFELAASTYYNLKQSRQDQSLVFLGETGSGKTTAYNVALRQLVTVSKSKKKEDRVAKRIAQSSVLLDAFGNAMTVQSADASRYGKLTELQFNSRFRVCGAKVSDYLLEKTRVTHVPHGERSFHAFYYLIAGASPTERATYNILGDASKYNYLSAGATYMADGIADADNFAALKEALKTLGFKDKYHEQIFGLLSAILAIGNLEFTQGTNKDEAAVVKNVGLLKNIADFLGLRAIDLENAFVFKTKLVKNEICTMFLDIEEAIVQRDSLARTLYGLLWTWLVDCVNKRLCEDEPEHLISLVDMFGLENLKTNRLHQLLYNYTAEKMLAFANEQVFDREVQKYHSEGVSAPDVSYGDNTKIVELLSNSKDGVLTLLDEESGKSRRKAKTAVMVEKITASHEDDQFFVKFPAKSSGFLFGIRHHGEEIHYDASEFLDVNTDHQISADFIALFRGGAEARPSDSSFMANLFAEKAIDVERKEDADTVVGGQQVNAPMRKPSTRRKKKDSKSASKTTSSKKPTFASQYRDALQELLDSLSETKVNVVYCVRPTLDSKGFDDAKVAAQIKSMGLSDVVRIRAKGYGAGLTMEAFAERYRLLAPAEVDRASNPRKKVEAIATALDWDSEEVVFGSSCAFVSETALRMLNLNLAEAVQEEKKRLKEMVNRPGSRQTDVDLQSDVESEASRDDASSVAGSDYTYAASDAESRVEGKVVGERDLAASKKKKEEEQPEEEEEPMTAVRRRWLCCTTLLTWWIPTCCIDKCGGMSRSDIQQAWREKVAICILIFLLSAIMVFFIAGFSLLLCPRDNMYDLGELSQYNTAADKWVAVRGNIFNYAKLDHSFGMESIDQYAGKDASELFYLSAEDCGLEEDVPTKGFINNTIDFWHKPESLAYLNPRNKRIWKGFLAFRKDEIARDHNKEKDTWVIINNRVYDITWYRFFNQRWLGKDVTAAIFSNPGGDLTGAFQKLGTEGRKALACMDKIYFKGVVDVRDSPQCVFANMLLLSATGVLVMIMLAKFLCALQFTSKGDPENYDRFVILQVPCYTEGEEGLRRTIESLTSLKYDDKRKLLFIISDGNIIGSGNDRPTWRIALDILGVDPSIDPPKLSFLSLGEGNRQHNMAKVYTGLYDFQGHLVPYVVVVKVGKDTETRRPGNRGKRDSQMILMRFLQKVHYDDPMSPLELEMFHQIKNVIGVDPSFYEFVLMVDADTEVMPDSLNRLVSSMVHDAKIVGLCGETCLANENESIITMVQVYEYYISHHLAKAFESMFGSVTCLPGCFCMYRIRTPNKSIPLLTSKPVIQDYAVNNVDTLHKKNLLSLGEDRYLTTLMLKHFPNMKIKFTPDAKCMTYAPEQYSVLLSQRRRWINSTIHNLLELLLLPQLCGFCCFSMRFVVFFDLFATLVMPASMGYFVYLIYTLVNSAVTGLNKNIPLITIILLAAAYGVQVIIFMLKRQWAHIIWLIIYLLALPLFALWLPLYSFWHMDDFSWGNTRVVVGERGGKKHIIDEEPFDPNSIPMKKWSEYEQEMWERDSQATGMTRPSQMGSQAQYSGLVPVAMAQPGLPGYAPSYDPRASVYSQGQRPVTMIQAAAPPGDEPTNEQITNQIKAILATANLMTVTKKQVRDELSSFFGMDMTPKKDFINKVIEDVLQGRL